MGNIKNLAGKKFGRLTAISIEGQHACRGVLWKCKCECGKNKVVLSASLSRGKTTSCGCLRRKNLTGMRFGKLTVLTEAGKDYRKNILWLCRCDCGKELPIIATCLTANHSKSCGCSRLESITKHGHAAGENPSPIYEVWAVMKDRCKNRNNLAYRNYGGRGVEVCSRWKNSFENFLKDMGERPSVSHSIDRIDNDGNYEPDNCRWATVKQQAQNKRTNVNITYQGETLCAAEWERELKIPKGTLAGRVKRLGPEEAIRGLKACPTKMVARKRR